jgi:hypothetical protein
VKVGADAGDELTGERLLRLFAALRTEGEIVLDGIAERPFQFADGRALEADDIPGVDDFAVEKPGLVVVLDPASISLVFHHGVTPASVR